MRDYAIPKSNSKNLLVLFTLNFLLVGHGSTKLPEALKKCHNSLAQTNPLVEKEQTFGLALL